MPDITRRTAASLLTATAVVCPGASGAPASGNWTPEWDRALLDAAVERGHRAFDPKESMIRTRIGPEYHYHTNLRARDVHPTRESLQYALYLLEAGNVERASAILDRLLTLQDSDPASKWFGVWSYHLEESLAEMDAVDFNWADFNGSALLLIDFRHRAKLGASLQTRLREGIRRAASAVRKRNVAMSYTNIAIQGTFVTLTAAELLGDEPLFAYAADRLKRFGAEVDRTGSFAEYNSPTYANVAIANLTRLRMYARDSASRELVDRIHTRFWQHVALHWHAPSKQLAGPMSRCYSTDIGSPLWLQKALDNRLMWTSLVELKDKARGGGEGETAMLNWKVPEQFLPHFLKLEKPRQHREVFLPASNGIRPVQGTTWLTPEFALGSVNRGDFWVQRRPLLAWWGSAPAKSAQLRFIHDDYDFASANLYSVQQQKYVVGFVNFKYPGGDKHPSLDVLKGGSFPASRLFLRLDLPEGTKLIRSTEAATAMVTADLGGGMRLAFQVRSARFNDYTGRLTLDGKGLSFDLLPPGTDTVRWDSTEQAWLAFTFTIESTRDSAAGFAERVAALPWNETRLEWKTPAGALALTAGRAVKPVAEQDRAFADSIDGQPVPMVRLSEERLV
ncbi:MAG: hypothetical protein SGI92_15440 [Bryobacteraceae bacterium]|nr:hypothetical protein [Bryobacteraceae bacterium]